jgi:hypothetical protein
VSLPEVSSETVRVSARLQVPKGNLENSCMPAHGHIVGTRLVVECATLALRVTLAVNHRSLFASLVQLCYLSESVNLPAAFRANRCCCRPVVFQDPAIWQMQKR